MLETNLKSAGLLLLATAVIPYGVLIIRRLFFHPLANFPGPKLAAISGFYLTYYDLVMNGGTVDQLEILHKKYGPVVRIAPGKLHFNDPRAFDEIYRSKFRKEAWFYDAVNRTEASFGFIDIRKTSHWTLGNFGNFAELCKVVKLPKVVKVVTTLKSREQEL